MSWTARTITAIDRLLTGLFASALFFGVPALAGVRDHTRLPLAKPAVSQTQATELSLATSEASIRPVQTLVRLRGLREGNTPRLQAFAAASDAKLLQVGQRVRVFSLQSRSSMIHSTIVA